MKNLLRVMIILVLCGAAFAGGIVTNTNQSAEFTRTLNRNASTELDAVYFNPAGISMLPDGFHLYLSSQTISQGREITSDVATLHNEMFEGTTFAPVFPNVYFAYKTGKIGIAGGFMPIGGGGSAEYPDGLPSFEVPASVLPASLVAAGIPTTDYSLDVSFEGSSNYFAGQLNLSYAINDMLSVAVGGRYFMANNSYDGYLKDIMIDPTYPAAGFDGSMTSAPAFFTTMSAALTGVATQASGAAASLQPAIDGGYGDVTFDNLVLGGGITQAEVDALAAGATGLGIPFDSSVATPNMIQPAFETAAAGYTAQAAGMDANAAATQDIEVKAKQTGSGFAPIVGLNINLMDKLNIGLRYEMLAPMTLTNDTEVDGSGLFTDGDETPADMPAMLGLGVSYLVMPSLRVEFDYNLYFNEDVDWGGKEAYVDNGNEIGFAAEFALSDALLLSGGYLISTGGATEAYQTDLSYSLNSSTLGLGARYTLNPATALTVGFSNTFYEEGTKSGVDYRGLITGTETYMKSAIVFALGLQRSF